jgi:hypothetical protein
MKFGKNQIVFLLSSILTASLYASKVITYEEFGAIGDGKTDDQAAIIAAHNAANTRGLKVQVNGNKTYYIGEGTKTAVIMTDVDFGSATFIIDDRNVSVKNRGNPIFRIIDKSKPFAITSVSKLVKGQTSLGITLPEDCLVDVVDETSPQYIRYGLNQNSGTAKKEVFLLSRTGEVNPRTPIMWDYTNITKMTAHPIPTKKLTISGGRFKTIANQAPSKYTYYSRGFDINRSNVLIKGLRHDIEGEGEHGAPYHGFLYIKYSANVTVSNCVLTAHKKYHTIGAIGKSVAMGSYDLTANNSVNISYISCRQTTNINDNRYWGLYASNYCKNLLFDDCVFSRFDAHMGVANATIRNSELGYMGINAIGYGTFLVENSTVRAASFFNLRSDYGSIWEGEFIVRNCTFIPSNGQKAQAKLINGASTDWHYFGYECCMPRKMVFDGLKIDDKNHPEKYNGPYIFTDFNSKNTSSAYVEKYPYQVTKEVILKNVTTTSGKPINLSPNAWMFRNTKVVRQ